MGLFLINGRLVFERMFIACCREEVARPKVEFVGRGGWRRGRARLKVKLWCDYLVINIRHFIKLTEIYSFNWFFYN